jgi:hypothetical protein
MGVLAHARLEYGRRVVRKARAEVRRDNALRPEVARRCRTSVREQDDVRVPAVAPSYGVRVVVEGVVNAAGDGVRTLARGIGCDDLAPAAAREAAFLERPMPENSTPSCSRRHSMIVFALLVLSDVGCSLPLGFTARPQPVSVGDW